MLRRPAELPQPLQPASKRSPAKEPAEIEALLALCRAGKLFEVEAWIDEGRPIQCEPPSDSKLQRRPTPLQVAVAKRFHSLAAPLLANGYDPHGD